MTRYTASGRCACGHNTYTLQREPMAVNVCHCLDCQRLSGSAFAVNLWIEESEVVCQGERVEHRVDSGSGKGHILSACKECGTYLWGRYLASPKGGLFIKGGTLDDAKSIQPSAHIFIKDKQEWVQLGSSVPQFAEHYDLKDVWSPESLERLKALIRSGKTNDGQG